MKKLFFAVALLCIFCGCVAAQGRFPRDARSAMDYGMCRRLAGRTVLCPVFVNAADKAWTQPQKDSVLAVARKAAEYFQCEAEAAGVALQIELVAAPPTAAVRARSNAIPLRDLHRLAGLDTLEASLRRRYSAYNVAFVMVIGDTGTSQAIGIYRDLPAGMEYVVYYPYGQGNTNIYTHASAFVHEVLHLFGAMDLYYPHSSYSRNMHNFDSNYYKALAFFGSCIMNSWREPQCPYYTPQIQPDGSVTNGERHSFIDEVTQYLIGWKEDYAPELERFFNMEG